MKFGKPFVGCFMPQVKESSLGTFINKEVNISITGSTEAGIC